MAPGKAGTALEVAEVVAIGVGFTLERYVEVSLAKVAVSEEPVKPFDYIKEIKGEEKEFAHLGVVDAFMVYNISVDPPGVAGPQGTEKV